MTKVNLNGYFLADDKKAWILEKQFQVKNAVTEALDLVEIKTKLVSQDDGVVPQESLDITKQMFVNRILGFLQKEVFNSVTRIDFKSYLFRQIFESMDEAYEFYELVEDKDYLQFKKVKISIQENIEFLELD